MGNCNLDLTALVKYVENSSSSNNKQRQVQQTVASATAITVTTTAITIVKKLDKAGTIANMFVIYAQNVHSLI